MEEIERLYSLNSNGIDKKNISTMNQLIQVEKDNLNKHLETMKLSITKIPKKYSNQTIESLEELLYSSDINEKITIYNVIKFMIEKQKNELFESK